MRPRLKDYLLISLVISILLLAVIGAGCDCDDSSYCDEHPTAEKCKDDETSPTSQSSEDTDDDTTADEPVNNDPVISGVEDLTMIEDSVAQTIDLTGKCTDEDGDAITWSMLDVDESILNVTLTQTSVTVNPMPNAYGTTGFTLVCADTYDAEASWAVTVTVDAVDEAPVISSTPGTEIVIGQEYTYAVIATDVDNHELTYSISGNPTDMTIDATGIITWTPAATGAYDITVIVTDPAGMYATQQFRLIAVES